MTIGNVIKRSFQALGCLWLLGVIVLGGVSAYMENNKEAQARLEISAKDAEFRVDEDAPFLTKVGVLVTSWWNSDELIEEAKTEKALDQQAEAKSKADEESRRFNDSSYNSSDDYYGGN